MACVSKTNLVLAKKFSHEDLSAITKSTQSVLEGSARRKIISNKNEAKQFKNGKQLTLKTATNSRREAVEKYYMYGTCTGNSNGRRIERPLHINLLNSSRKASRYATRRQINSADGSIIAACKLQQYFYFLVARYYIWTCRMRETNPKIEGFPSFLSTFSPSEIIPKPP